MVCYKRCLHTDAMSAAITQFAMKLLYKIATVLVALLLYGVIAVLQSPKARADGDIEFAHTPYATCATQVARTAQHA